MKGKSMRAAPEQWRPIPGYEGLYEASDHGRIRSLDRLIPHAPNGIRRRYWGVILKQFPRNGYLTVTLSRNGVACSTSVHKLILITFIGPRPEGMEACHGNGVCTDNRPSNLRWGTSLENAQDRERHGTVYQCLKTHCKRGHEFNAENTRHFINVRGRPARSCRACAILSPEQRARKADLQRARARRKREAAA